MNAHRDTQTNKQSLLSLVPVKLDLYKQTLDISLAFFPLFDVRWIRCYVRYATWFMSFIATRFVMIVGAYIYLYIHRTLFRASLNFNSLALIRVPNLSLSASPPRSRGTDIPIRRDIPILYERFPGIAFLDPYPELAPRSFQEDLGRRVMPDEYELPRKFRRPEDVPCSRSCSDIRAEDKEGTRWSVDKSGFLGERGNGKGLAPSGSTTKRTRRARRKSV